MEDGVHGNPGQLAARLVDQDQDQEPELVTTLLL